MRTMRFYPDYRLPLSCVVPSHVSLTVSLGGTFERVRL